MSILFLEGSFHESDELLEMHKVLYVHELHEGDISPLSIGHNLDAEWAICILYMRLQRIYRNYYFMPPSSDNHRQGLKWLPKSGGASSNTVVMWRGAPAAGACYSAKNLSPWLI